jgi:hypothetical protein
MNNGAATAALQRAVEISRELAAVAEGGDVRLAVSLDAERLLLLKSFRVGRKQPNAGELALLREISQLNHRSIGSMEHRLRSKGRAMDMAVVGRRAVAAYSNTRQR